jgi:hypothetical protein
MRLTKTVYLLGEGEEVIVSYNDFGEPIYEMIPTRIPIQCEIEPYSSKLAENRYGIIVDVQYRLFTKPDERLKLGEKMEYKDKNYTITGVMDYDHHYEVLIKKDDSQ